MLTLVHKQLAAPASTVDRIMREPQVQHRRLVETAVHSRLGKIKLVGTPLTFSTMTPSVRQAAPTYGEHTDEILKEAGLSEAEVAALRAKGMVR